ncbi:MAG: hypothetical protein M1346_01170 [Gammaproteobacteria bacterium]|nr:hypothetical protein [Gammaproteobacteria bacterium]
MFEMTEDEILDHELQAIRAENHRRESDEADRAEAKFERDLITIPEIEYMLETEPEYMQNQKEIGHV